MTYTSEKMTIRDERLLIAIGEQTRAADAAADALRMRLIALAAMRRGVPDFAAELAATFSSGRSRRFSARARCSMGLDTRPLRVFEASVVVTQGQLEGGVGERATYRVRAPDHCVAVEMVTALARRGGQDAGVITVLTEIPT